jgi:hypothetical protein
MAQLLNKGSKETFSRFWFGSAPIIPWIPEPSVNNKLKRREGSGSTGGFFD